MTNTQTETNKDRVALMIAAATCEAIDAAGVHGASDGIVYVALMAHGCTVEQFNSLMGTLVRLGAVEKRGELYFCTERGRALVRGSKVVK